MRPYMHCFATPRRTSAAARQSYGRSGKCSNGLRSRLSAAIASFAARARTCSLGDCAYWAFSGSNSRWSFCGMFRFFLKMVRSPDTGSRHRIRGRRSRGMVRQRGLKLPCLWCIPDTAGRACLPAPRSGLASRLGGAGTRFPFSCFCSSLRGRGNFEPLAMMFDLPRSNGGIGALLCALRVI